jgi:hypothetical protein
MTVFESFFSYARMQTQVVSQPATEPAREFAFAREGRAGEVYNVYNEEAFRHFLTIERARAERSHRPLLLLLVGLHRCPKAGFEVSPEHSSALFSGLGECVRDVDFLGWYRERRVLGAVLTQGLGAPCVDDIHPRIAKRVQDVLRSHVSDDVAKRLRVRVVQLGSRA